MFVSLFHINWYDYSSDSNGISDHHQYWWPLIRVFSFWIELFEWLTFKYTQELMESNKSMDLAFWTRMSTEKTMKREMYTCMGSHPINFVFSFIRNIYFTNEFWEFMLMPRGIYKVFTFSYIANWKLICHRFWIGRCTMGKVREKAMITIL